MSGLVRAIFISSERRLDQEEMVLPGADMGDKVLCALDCPKEIYSGKSDPYMRVCSGFLTTFDFNVSVIDWCQGGHNQ